MKNTNKKSMLVIAMSICTLALFVMSITIVNVFAYEKSAYAAEVNSVKYENYADAWAAVENGGTITMLKDWNIEKVLTVNENKTVNVKMNGFMINRGLNGKASSGEVFLVKSGASLNIEGEANSTVEHKGNIQGDMWHYNLDGKHVIKGALITGGYNSNGGGAIHIEKNAAVKIENVTIAGNATTDGSGAGAIRLQGENSKLTAYDSDICYNKVTNSNGAAIVVNGKGAVAQLLGTKINNNVVTYGKGNGGAIQINNGEVSIAKSPNRVSEISFNTAGKNGGAIYVSNGNLRMNEDVIVARNVAGNEGGAIYVDSGADIVDIKGIFSGNSAQKVGGAVYVNSSISGNNGVKISNAEFLGNHSVLHGGAIYVDSDNDISLSGKVIINGNTPNNLYIQKSGTIKTNSLTDGSKVGIYTSWNATKSSPVSTANYKYFVSDKVGYNISGESNSAYYVAESTKGAPENITVGGYTYPVSKGTFTYDPLSSGPVSAYFYYSDGYFAQSARYYNEHLATMSSSLAISAASASCEGEYFEYKAAKNIIALFEEAGFKKIAIRYPEPEYFGTDSEILSTIGYVIASREITVNGRTVTLIAIAVRGGNYEAEWASNVTLGDGVGEAKGFCDAANQVEAGIIKYLKDYEIETSAAKFWITGFSRAGATSNLVAKRLTDQYGESDVYAYCFEAPKGGVYSLLKSGMTYSNIHNVINATDIVPFVGTTEMGFIRYGVDHILPGYAVGTEEYEQQKNIMRPHFSAIAPDAAFNDYFHEATVSYILSTIQGIFTDNATLVKEETFEDFDTAAEWHPYFIKRMQEYSLTNNVEDSIYNKDSVNWQGYRNYWSTYKWYLYEDTKGNLQIKCYGGAPEDFETGKYYVLTIEESVATVMNFYYGMDGAKKDAIVKAIDLNTIKDKISVSDIYFDIIGEWNEFSIKEKNSKFNELWNTIEVEKSLKDVLTAEEMATMKRCLYVLLDFGLDFVSDDYDYESQDLIGTLVYNISNIMQTHYYETLHAWARSYDSFYAGGDLIAPPNPPHASLEGGYYNESFFLQLIPDNKNYTIYYTTDGTTPSRTNGMVYRPAMPIALFAYDGDPRTVTVKAVAVYEGLVSDVVTYNYCLNTNAVMDVYEDVLHVYNFDGSAYLVLAEYEDGFLRDIEYFAVTDNDYFFFEDSSLNFENKVVAYLVRGFEFFTPLCDSVCLTAPSDKVNNITVYSQNSIEIESFEIKQAENPKFINVRFTTKSNNAEFLIVSLYNKDAQLDIESFIYFNQLEKSEDNTYVFTIERSRLNEMLGGKVNSSSLIFAVTANGKPDISTKSTIYEESVYTITYHLNGGINNPKNPDVFTEHTVPFFLSDPTKEHYQFVCWSDSNGNPVYAIDPNETKQNVELYAKWEILNYDVVYNDGADGTVFSDVTYIRGYGSPTPKFTGKLTREGYTFVGWDKEISSTVEDNVMYTAVWHKDHVHEPILVEGANATCSVPGYSSYYECANCGYFEDEDCSIAIIDIELWKQTDGKLTAEHIFTNKVQDMAHLVDGTGVNCQDTFKYYYGCANCDAIGTEAWVSDTYGEHNIDVKFTASNGQHYHVCSNEGCDYVIGRVDCVGGEATCKERAICAVCGNAHGELGLHTPEEDDGDCTTAIICSTCKEEITPAKTEHKDGNSDGKCDSCEYKMPIVPDPKPENPDPKPDTDPDAKPDTDPDAKPDTDIDVKPDADPDTKPDTETDTKPDVESDKESEKSTEDNSDKKKKGCGSSVTFSALAIVGIVGIALGIKKKED